MKSIKISEGAEAQILLKENVVLKDRIKKNYRINVLDDKLRKSRTVRETKILKRLEKINFDSPKLISSDNNQKIEMEFIKGLRLRDVLNEENYFELCAELGEKIKSMHNNNIIHGDLTTSNMIYKDKIYFIDFGLSFISHKIEDKAVDLHLLKQALESKHYKIWKKCFDEIIKSYNDSEVMKRLEEVELRGRYKHKS